LRARKTPSTEEKKTGRAGPDIRDGKTYNPAREKKRSKEGEREMKIRPTAANEDPRGTSEPCLMGGALREGMGEQNATGSILIKELGGDRLRRKPKTGHDGIAGGCRATLTSQEARF